MTAPAGSDDGRGDDALESMRAVWISMRDEEPPSSGLAELLAAARTKAESMRPREPWWRRALIAARRPPVLALASAILLVGGGMWIAGRGAESESTAVRAAAPELKQSAAMEQAAESAPVDRGGAVEDTQPMAGAPAAEEQAPAAAPPAPAAMTTSAGRQIADDLDATPPLAQLAKQAETAAARGDCTAVRAIVDRIRALDAAYHRDHVARHAAVKRCLTR